MNTSKSIDLDAFLMAEIQVKSNKIKFNTYFEKTEQFMEQMIS